MRSQTNIIWRQVIQSSFQNLNMYTQWRKYWNGFLGSPFYHKYLYATATAGWNSTCLALLSMNSIPFSHIRLGSLWKLTRYCGLQTIYIYTSWRIETLNWISSLHHTRRHSILSYLFGLIRPFCLTSCGQILTANRRQSWPTVVGLQTLVGSIIKQTESTKT